MDIQKFFTKFRLFCIEQAKKDKSDNFPRCGCTYSANPEQSGGMDLTQAFGKEITDCPFREFCYTDTVNLSAEIVDKAEYLLEKYQPNSFNTLKGSAVNDRKRKNAC